MELLAVFSAFGLAASAGLNAYIPLLVVSLLAKYTDLITLKAPWDGMTSWWVIGILIVLIIIEFFADKIPVVNHINDIIQTFVRPTAGAIVFAASTSIIKNVNPVLSIILGLLVAGSIHAVKSALIRPAVTAVSGGIGNIPVSIAEDGVSTGVSIIAIVLPVLVACILVLTTALIIWFIWRRVNKQKAKKKRMDESRVKLKEEETPPSRKRN